MLKEFIVGAAAIAAGIVPFSGVAAADEGHGHASDDRDSGQIGLVNVNNLDVLHNVTGTVGFCDNNVNVLGVQVPVRDTANGVGVPVLSPGATEAAGATPYNCASGETSDGGTIQGN